MQNGIIAKMVLQNEKSLLYGVIYICILKIHTHIFQIGTFRYIMIGLIVLRFVIGDRTYEPSEVCRGLRTSCKWVVSCNEN